MARRRKKRDHPLQGQINFYKAMAVLGLIIAGGFVYQFLDSAPALSRRPYHVPTDPAGECLNCHLGQNRSTPIMPHRPMDSCTFCHSPPESPASP